MMDSVTCILVLVVSMFTTRSREFTQKCQFSPNRITDFITLPNRMCLLEAVVFESYSQFVSQIFGGFRQNS
jgi:hypothetical protein